MLQKRLQSFADEHDVDDDDDDVAGSSDDDTEIEGSGEGTMQDVSARKAGTASPQQVQRQAHKQRL